LWSEPISRFGFRQERGGWTPVLNDGIRLNIRPFMTIGDVKKKGAGVLRDKPNNKWGKYRGKDVASAPWCSGKTG